jgi:hypothetical protein
VTREEAEALRGKRAAQRPGFEWRVERRGDEWIVMRLPGGVHIDAGTVEAGIGEVQEVREDPRPIEFRDLPPYIG